MGNEKNLRPLTTELAREIGAKGGRAKARKAKERKMIADALRQVLDEPLQKGSRQTKLDGIAIKAIKNLYDNPSVKGLKVLAEILGEMETKFTAEGLTLNISSSNEGKDNINRILDGEE